MTSLKQSRERERKDPENSSSMILTNLSKVFSQQKQKLQEIILRVFSPIHTVEV